MEQFEEPAQGENSGTNEQHGKGGAGLHLIWVLLFNAIRIN